MGSLDLSNESTLASNTQSTHLIKHSHTQPLDMYRTFRGTKTKKETRVKQYSDSNFDFQGCFGPNMAKIDSTTPKKTWVSSSTRRALPQNVFQLGNNREIHPNRGGGNPPIDLYKNEFPVWGN